MKKLIVLLCATTLCGGCCSSATSLIRALRNDPATVHCRITSIYGVVEFDRANPGTNTIPHRISADGSVLVGEK